MNTDVSNRLRKSSPWVKSDPIISVLLIDPLTFLAMCQSIQTEGSQKKIQAAFPITEPNAGLEY